MVKVIVYKTFEKKLAAKMSVRSNTSLIVTNVHENELTFEYGSFCVSDHVLRFYNWANLNVKVIIFDKDSNTSELVVEKNGFIYHPIPLGMFTVKVYRKKIAGTLKFLNFFKLYKI